MSPEWLTAIGALIVATATFIAACVGALVARANSQRAERAATAAKEAAAAAKVAAEDSKSEIIATKNGVFELGKQVDGRLSELLKVSIAAARAEGKEAGEQAQRDRSNPEPQA